MLSNLKIFAASMLVILVMDFIWLAHLGKPLYMKYLKPFFNMGEFGLNVNYAAAGVVYICLILGVIIFVLPLASTLKDAICFGAIFGLLVYAVYDFTNMAIMKDWPLFISIVDVLWGGFLCAMVSAVSFYLKTA